MIANPGAAPPTGASDPAVTTSPRQRVLLHDLKAMYEERAKREEVIEKTFKQATAGSDREVRQAREEVEERHQKAVAGAESAFREQSAKIAERFDSEASKLRREYEAEKAQIQGKTDTEERTAVKGLKDRRWAAETIYEGNEGKPKAEFELTRKEIEKRLQDHTATESNAALVLKEYRQPVHPGETGEQPADWVEPEGTPSERYTKLALASQERVAWLAALPLPRFFSNLAVPVILALLLAGGAAAAAAWQMGWKPTPEVGLAAGGTLILTTTLLVLLARTGAKQVRRARGPLLHVMAAAREAAEQWLAHAGEKRDQHAAQLLKARDEEINAAKAKYEPVILEVRQRRTDLLAAAQRQYAAKKTDTDATRAKEGAAVSARRAEAMAAAQRTHDEQLREVETRYEQQTREARESHEEQVRLLLSLPPGKVRFTFIDPIGLGQSFAGFMHLADYEEAIVGDKIWTDAKRIEQRLVDLTDHMENVIQKYLRNEFATIHDYNQQAGEVAEPFRFLVSRTSPPGFPSRPPSASRASSPRARAAACTQS
jgi:hypothetical protein